MTETANTPPLEQKNKKENGLLKNSPSPLKLFQQYCVEKEKLAAKAGKGNLRTAQQTRLNDLDTRLIPSAVRRMNSSF